MDDQSCPECQAILKMLAKNCAQTNGSPIRISERLRRWLGRWNPWRHRDPITQPTVMDTLDGIT